MVSENNFNIIFKTMVYNKGRRIITMHNNQSIVYFTKDLSSEGLLKISQKVMDTMTGKIAVKLHTGEKYGPNIIPRDWVENLIKTEMPQATIVETNTYYEGDRYTTNKHRETLKVNGWTF